MSSIFQSRLLPRLVPDHLDMYDESQWIRVQGSIHILRHSEAIAYAKQYSDKASVQKFPGVYAVFTDGAGSRPTNELGFQYTSASVVWRNKATPKEWEKLGFSLPRNGKSGRAEIWAIYKALHLAYEKVIDNDPERYSFHTLKIFTDYRSLLNKLEKLKEEDGRMLRWRDELINELLWLDGALAACGITVEYHFVPSKFRPDIRDPDRYPPPPPEEFSGPDRAVMRNRRIEFEESSQREIEWYEDEDLKNRRAAYSASP
ncbi:hypothetical protein UCDDS831_g07321 [Diplodia seriata]|uniref:Uncharacterized protein n=1 Tax=Diplodia seriata TaxID=420778 RepID=A0A0G2GGB4_9PEZI|nr:hypothetical protein UCDDS831_g07321 [Diplodia seriata]